MLSAPKQWREWMPLDTSDFISSEDIFAMSPTEFKGYMFLIICQWESETGYLLSNEQFIQKRSRLTADQWEGARVAIMEKFEETEHGLSNPRCRKELDKILQKYLNRREGAKKTNESRWGVPTPKPSIIVDHRSLSVDHRSLSVDPSLLSSSLLSSSLALVQVPALGLEEPERLERHVGLKGLETQKQFTNQAKNDQSEIADGCDKSVNHSTLSLEVSLDAVARDSRPQSNSQVAAPYPNTRQERVESTTQGKRPENMAMLPQLGDWPESLDPSQAIETLLSSYAKPTMGQATQYAALEAIDRLVSKGRTRYEAYLYLTDRMAVHKLAMSHYPRGQGRFIAACATFLNDEIYNQNPELWSAPDAPDADDQPLITAEVRAREKARRAGHDDGRFIPMLGKEELRKLQADARARAWGPQYGDASAGA